MATILLIAHPMPRLWGWGQLVKFQLFQHMVMLHIKLKGIVQQHGSKYLPTDNPLPTRPYGMGFKVIIQLFQNMVMLHIKLKKDRECSYMVANICPHTNPFPPKSGDGSIGQISNFSTQSHVAYQIKENHAAT